MILGLNEHAHDRPKPIIDNFGTTKLLQLVQGKHNIFTKHYETYSFWQSQNSGNQKVQTFQKTPRDEHP